MGVIAVHRLSAAVSRECVTHHQLLGEIDRPDEWVVLLTRISGGENYGRVDPIDERDQPPPYEWLNPPAWWTRRHHPSQ